MDLSGKYLEYDPDELWLKAVTAHVNAGGDVLYPGDEKEMNLRGVLAFIVELFAYGETYVRQKTRRYATGENLERYGEEAHCPIIEASAAKGLVQMTCAATGEAKIIPAGTQMTPDGEKFYALDADIGLNGHEQTMIAAISCTEAGTKGNGVMPGTEMVLVENDPAVTNVVVVEATAGGNDREDEELYRERIGLAQTASSTAGPSNVYNALAMSASTDIIDAETMMVEAGVPGIYLILQEGADAESVFAAVRAACSADDKRPLTDMLVVAEAETLEYVMEVTYALEDGADASAASAVAAAAEAYRQWQDETIGRVFNPDKLKSDMYAAGAVYVNFEDTSTFNGGELVRTKLTKSQRCRGAIHLTQVTEEALYG